MSWCCGTSPPRAWWSRTWPSTSTRVSPGIQRVRWGWVWRAFELTARDWITACSFKSRVVTLICGPTTVWSHREQGPLHDLHMKLPPSFPAISHRRPSHAPQPSPVLVHVGCQRLPQVLRHHALQVSYTPHVHHLICAASCCVAATWQSAGTLLSQLS